MTVPLVLRIALYLLVADGLFALYLAESRARAASCS